jgi:hypothetical protein
MADCKYWRIYGKSIFIAEAARLMLFPLNPNTPRCKVFEKLNAELLFFIQKSIKSKRFIRGLFSREMGEVCWDNEPTKEKFKAVFGAMPPALKDRQAIYDSIHDAQNLSELFSDKTKPIPSYHSKIFFAELKKLTTHLFTDSKKLVGVIRVANESITQHYQLYVGANSELCFLCATSALSHNRFNIADNDQWTSDYDHILCKDKYPAFSCHPDNFIPTCHICNSKAKGALDVLYDDLTRRKAFYPLPPLMQSFYQKVKVQPVFAQLDDYAADGNSNPLRSAQISYPRATPDEREMIKAWVDLYQVPKRVGERITTTFCEYIDGDCAPENFGDFCAQVARKSRNEPADMKTTEWRFWWFRLYEWLNAQTADIKRDAWALIEWKQRQVNIDDDAFQTFGI